MSARLKPESFTSRLEGRNRLPQHGMSGLRPPPASHQCRFFLFDLLTDRSMAHALLFREGVIDTMNFSLGYFFNPLLQRRY
jgi:hypothetical protein